MINQRTSPSTFMEAEREEVQNTTRFSSHGTALHGQQLLLPKQKHTKGKRKGRKSRDQELSTIGTVIPATRSPNIFKEKAEKLYSNDEDGEVDGMCDGPEEAENSLKNEEGRKSLPEFNLFIGRLRY